MKEKRTSAVLSVILATLLIFLVALIHVVAQLTIGTMTFGSFYSEFILAPFANLVTFLMVPTVSATYIGTASVLGIALILAIVWILRLLINRRNPFNLLSPLLFLVGVLAGLFAIIYRGLLETAFAGALTEIASVYLIAVIIVVIALTAHLLVIGLATSGRKKESLLKETPLDVEEDLEDDEDDDDEEDEDEEEIVEEEPVVEVVEEKVVAPAPEPVREEEKAPAPVVNYADPELLAAIRKVVREELDARPVVEKVVIQKVIEETVKVEPAPVKEEPKRSFPPVRQKAAPAPKPAPVVKPEPKKVVPPPVVAPTRVFEEEETDGASERVPFAERVKLADDGVQVNYNVIKNFLMSYDVKSRLSHSGDSFRIGRKLVAKITTSGKSGLKIYLPLNLADYADSKMPLKDASHIKQYQDVPVMLYIKSDLSVKRAQQLIDDVMIANAMARKYEREPVDYVSEM